MFGSWELPRKLGTLTHKSVTSCKAFSSIFCIATLHSVLLWLIGYQEILGILIADNRQSIYWESPVKFLELFRQFLKIIPEVLSREGRRDISSGSFYERSRKIHFPSKPGQ